MHKFLSSSSTSICLAVVALYLQICFALKLSPVHGTTSSSKGHKLDLMGEMKLLRSTFLHSFALVESEWDSIEWNNDNKGDIFASDRLGPLKYAMERWNTVEKRMYQKNGVDYSQTRTYQEALRTAAAANAILGSAHWRRGDYHESAPLLREGCFSLWGSPFLDNQLQETHTWIECFGLLGEFYLSGKEDIETEEVRQLVVFVQTAFPWLVTSLLDRSDDTLGKEDVPVGSAEPNDVTQEEDVAIEGIAPIVVFKALLTLHRLTRPQGHALSVHITKAWTLISDTREQCHGVLSAFLPEHYDAWTPTTKNAAAEKATTRIREIHESSSQLFSSLIETSSLSRVNKTSAAKQAQHVDMGEADSSKLAKERRVEGAPEKYMHDDDVDRITRKMLRGVAELLSTEIEHYVTVVTELVATVSTKSGLIATVQRGGYGAELTPNELETEELAEPFGVSSLNAIRRVMARTVREVFDLDAAAPSSSPVAGENDASDDTRSRHRRASRRGAPSSSQQKRQEWSYFFGGQWLWWDIINAVLYSLLGIAGTVLVAGSDFVSPHMEISLRKWGARVLEADQGHDSSFLKKRSPRNGSAAAAIALKRGHKIALSASGHGKSPVSSSNPTSTTADLVMPVQEVAELGLVDKRNSYIAIMSHSCSAIATKLCTTARRGSLLCKAFSFVVLDSSTHFAKSVWDRTLVYLQSSFQRAAGTNRSEHVASELLRSLDGGVSVSSGSGNCGGGGGKIRAGRQALVSVHKRKGKKGARRRDGQACASSAVRPEAASAVPKGGAEDLQEEPDAVAATTTAAAAAAAAASDITSGENGGDGIDEATRTVLRELAAGNVAASGGLRSPSPHNGAYDQPEEDWITERGKRRKAHRDSAPLSNTHAVSAIDSPRERERSMRTANQAVNGRRERKNKKKSPSHRDLSANANSRPMSSSQLFSPSPEDEGEMDNFPPLNGCNVELTMPLNDAPARSRTRDEGLDDFSLGSESDDTTSQSNTSSSPKLSPQRLRSSWDGNVVRSRFASSTVIARSNTSSTSPSDASLATCSSRTTYASAISISDDYQDTRKHDEGLGARQLKSYPSHKRNRGVRHSAESGDMQEGRPQSQSYGVIQRKAKRYPQPRGTMVNDQKNRILHRPDDPDLDKNDAFSVHSVAESSLTGSDEGEVFTSYHNDDMGSRADYDEDGGDRFEKHPHHPNTAHPRYERHGGGTQAPYRVTHHPQHQQASYAAAQYYHSPQQYIHVVQQQPYHQFIGPDGQAYYAPIPSEEGNITFVMPPVAQGDGHARDDLMRSHEVPMQQQVHHHHYVIQPQLATDGAGGIGTCAMMHHPQLEQLEQSSQPDVRGHYAAPHSSSASLPTTMPSSCDDTSSHVHTDTKAALRRQIEYYFSEENLARDKYLLSLMDADGYVDIAEIAKFNRTRELLHSCSMTIGGDGDRTESDLELLMSLAASSSCMEVVIGTKNDASGAFAGRVRAKPRQS